MPRFSRRVVQSILASVRALHGVAERFEVFSNEPAEFAVIIDDQDAGTNIFNRQALRWQFVSRQAQGNRNLSESPKFLHLLNNFPRFAAQLLNKRGVYSRI